MSERVVYPIGAWLLVILSLALWGTHGAPLVLRRHWYEMQMAVALLFAIPLLFTMTIEVWDATEEVTAALVGGMGILGLRYAILFGARATLAASCLALLSAAWFYGTSKGGALGVVLSLVASAALLLWVSTRVGWRREGVQAESPDSVDGRAGSP
jgi:hypothetical protein